MRLEAAVSSLTEKVSNLKKLTLELLEELPEDSEDQGNQGPGGHCCTDTRDWQFDPFLPVDFLLLIYTVKVGVHLHTLQFGPQVNDNFWL